MTHRTVWYRPGPKQSRWRPIRAWEDVGVLEISPGSVAFHGEHGDVVLVEPRTVSVGQTGRDFINTWITVEDRDGSRALFADGSRFGWGGLSGGTARLAAEIRRASPQPT